MIKVLVLVVFALALVKASDNNDYVWTSDNPRQLFEAIPGLPTYRGVNINITEDAPKQLHRIVNGHIAHPHQFPYMAAIFFHQAISSTLCGGSLISERFVLTAAQCGQGFIQYIEVLLGANYYDKKEPTQQRILAKSFRPNLAFSSSLHLHDIAVIELEEKAVKNDYVQTIGLPSLVDLLLPIPKSMSTFVGWGRIRSDGERSESLKYMNSRVLPVVLCMLKSNPIYHICTERTNNNDNICFEDFGGPLVVRGKQVGIASYVGDGCQGSYFTRVAAYRRWIAYNTDVPIKLF